jgi:hypothetical protein
MKRFEGLGLPEMLISLFLASLIMTALLQHYISIKQHYRTLQSTLDTANETQWVIDLIRHSIRQAGFTPCLRVDRLIARDHRQGQNRLKAIDTDNVLQINRMSSHFDEVNEWVNSSQLITTRTQTFHSESSLLIADCYHAEVVTAKAVKHMPNKQMISLNQALLFTYQPPVFIGEWIEERFFIRKSRLLYRYHHTDELTSTINTLSVHIKAAQVNVTIGQTNGQKLRITTRIRA